MESAVDRALTPDPRERKLAVWAQNVINDLRRYLAQVHRAGVQSRLESDPEGSNAVLEPYGDVTLGLAPIGLGPDAHVEYRLAPHQEVRIRASEGRLHVMSVGGRLIVRPTSSNTVTVEVDPR